MSSRICGHVAILSVVFGLFGQPQTVLAQVPTDASASTVQDLVKQVNALQHEVRNLRERHENTNRPSPVSHVSLNEESSAESAAAGHLETQPATDATGECECECECECYSSGCDCHSCECPLAEAACIDCPRVSTLGPNFNVSVFGFVKLDMLFNAKRPISPGTPFFLLPESAAGFEEDTFDAHARQSTIAAALTGPQFGGFQSGGLVMAMFYNDAVIVDQYGFLPLQAYGELKNDDWRFAAGLQFDVFSPGIPTILPFSALGASGNSGNSFRGQVRIERYLQPAEDIQWTIQAALSEPIASTIDPSFRLAEDNGWPNVEGRVALGLGCIEGEGAAAQRPFEVGVSGVVGEIRTTIPVINQVVADVWGIATDFRWKMNDVFGVAGELFTGKTLGTYNAGILQGINPVTLEGIRSSGGWIESFVYWTPCVHTHAGYGIDEPDSNDIAPTGRLKNETYYANVLWDVNATFRIGFEVTWRETEYRTLPNNEGAGFHTQFQWAF